MAASKALNIKDQLYEDLKDPAYASAYINEAILDGDEAVLKTALLKTALGDVIRAKGVAAVARKAGINRVTVYKTLKPGTESSFTTMLALLKACNVSLQVLPTEPRSTKRA
jgi:probable addiction module antidote protein